jgi:hypothetical protein
MQCSVVLAPLLQGTVELMVVVHDHVQVVVLCAHKGPEMVV